MNKQDLDEFLKITENLDFDLKMNCFDPQELRKDIIAFANGCKIGKIFYGIKDDGTLKGLTRKEMDELKNRIENVISKNIDPPINPRPNISECLFENDKIILCLEIYPKDTGFYAIRRNNNVNNADYNFYQFWIRRNGNKELMTMDILNSEFYYKNQPILDLVWKNNKKKTNVSSFFQFQDHILFRDFLYSVKNYNYPKMVVQLLNDLDQCKNESIWFRKLTLRLNNSGTSTAYNIDIFMEIESNYFLFFLPHMIKSNIQLPCEKNAKINGIKMFLGRKFRYTADRNFNFDYQLLNNDKMHWKIRFHIKELKHQMYSKFDFLIGYTNENLFKNLMIFETTISVSNDGMKPIHSDLSISEEIDY